MLVDVKGKEFVFIKNIKPLGPTAHIEDCGGGLYEYYDPLTKFKQTINQRKYNLIMEACGLNKPIVEAKTEVKEPEAPILSKKEQLMLLTKKELFAIASEDYVDLKEPLNKTELVDLIIEAKK